MTEPPPRIRLLGLVGGFIVTQTIHAVVRLGVPDLVADRPRPVEELAEASGADADALRRAIRTLASLGVFADADDIVRHTELSELLRTDVPDSVAAQVRLLAGLHYRTWGDSYESFRTGEPAFARVHGRPMFDWFEDHAEEAETFNRAMAHGAVGRRTRLLARGWTDARTVVDVGGGTGGTLIALLAQEPHLSGIVLDLAHARDEAERAIAAAGLADRCRFVEGSFFEAVPDGGDAYVLSAILHDWGDVPAAAILRTCRAAMGDAARLLLVEAVIEPGAEPDWSKVMDLHMLVALGGRERSEDEWRALLGANGFRLEPATSGLLEASPA